jgi:hypothetical protein
MFSPAHIYIYENRLSSHNIMSKPEPAGSHKKWEQFNTGGIFQFRFYTWIEPQEPSSESRFLKNIDFGSENRTWFWFESY